MWHKPVATCTPVLPLCPSINSSTFVDMDKYSLADSNLDGSCHMMSRKKRRGLIEKRRRDRINNSLHELKRLVPAAFEKQGSAKLEKAEILQMTVDHLRMLHSKGFDAFSFDPHKFATDYHVIGFRECATEVARYLAVHEGIDFQDPLRLRLMTHLHSYSSQRELSLKACTGWNPSLFTTPMYPSAAAAPTTPQSSVPAAISASPSALSSQPASSSSVPACDNSMQLNSSSSSHHSHSYTSSYYSNQSTSLDNSMMSSSGSGGSMTCSSALHPPSSSKSPSAFSSLGYSLGSTPAIATPPTSVPSSYTYPYTGAGSYFAPSAASYMPPMMPTASSNNLTGANANAQSSVKHYRPWGTELAY